MLRKALRYCVAGVAVIVMALVALRMTAWWDGLLPPGDHRVRGKADLNHNPTKVHS